MTSRQKIVVTITQNHAGFWQQFMTTCRKRGVPYSRALTMGARLWMDQLHAQGEPVERSSFQEENDWYPLGGS